MTELAAACAPTRAQPGLRLGPVALAAGSVKYARSISGNFAMFGWRRQWHQDAAHRAGYELPT